MIGLSETYIYSSYADDDTRLNLKEFTLIREDNPHNCKRGAVNIYFEEHLTVRPVSPLNLKECLVLEINIRNRKEYVISMYQRKYEFDQFLLNFEQLISNRISQNLHFILVTGGFNFQSSSWCKNDLTTSEGNQVNAITSSYGLSQLICEPAHILPYSSLCSDLILINQNNFICIVAFTFLCILIVTIK